MLWAILLQSVPIATDNAVLVPVNDEGWVFPTQRSLQASSVCPKMGRVTVGFVQTGNVISYYVKGMGRSSSPADVKSIKTIFGSLQSVESIDVGCWGQQAALIAVRGPGLKDGRITQVRVDFLWSEKGPQLVPANAIYPSIFKSK